MNELAKTHQKEFETTPILCLDVPQVTTILGDVSDIVGGKTLLCTNDHGLKAVLSLRQDNLVRVINVVRQDKKKFSLSSLKFRKEDKWANAVKAILSEFSKEGYHVTGMSISLGGVGAGTDNASLTASIFIGMANAVNRLFHFDLTKEQILALAYRANCFSPEYQARYRDLWILLHAEQGKVYLFDQTEKSFQSAEFSLGSCHAYLLNSALPYSVLTPEENEIRQECQENYEQIQKNLRKDLPFRALSEKEVKAFVSRMPERQRRILTHLSLSNDLAQKAFDAISSHKGSELGRILSLYQKSLSSNAELASPELDWIHRRGQEDADVLGLSMVGVGIAGTFLLIVENLENNFYDSHVEEYERIFGFHPDIRAFVPFGSVQEVILNA